MNVRSLHKWNVTPKEAIAIQHKLRGMVSLTDRTGDINPVAGVDVGFNKTYNTGRAAVAILSFPDLVLREDVCVEDELTFPYVPGLLSFREMPLVLKALEKVSIAPDLFICDGQGISHPRRLGIACHLGLFTSTPAIGAAKSRLIGTHGSVPQKKGQWCPLMDGDEHIGAVLRSREGVKPIYVSPGHLISLRRSVELVMACLTGYKLPETTRMAHKLSLFRS